MRLALPAEFEEFVDPTNYNAAADRLIDRAKEAFMLFRAACLHDDHKIEGCACSASKGTISECHQMCHEIWGWDFKNGEPKCPCLRWGSWEAEIRLRKLCMAIERTS